MKKVIRSDHRRDNLRTTIFPTAPTIKETRTMQIDLLMINNGKRRSSLQDVRVGRGATSAVTSITCHSKPETEAEGEWTWQGKTGAV